MNRFLKTTAILSTIALVSAGAYSLNREAYRKGQASIKPQVESNQSELELKLSQTQIDLASKIEENAQLRQQVTTLQAEKEDLISSGEASQDEIDDLNNQIDILNDTIADNESSINTLNVKVTKMNSIVAKTITEVEAEDLEDFTEVSSYMFAGCTQLTDVTIPDNITNIGSNAFEGCTSLTDITMQSATPPTLANTNAIPSGVNINIPDNSREAYQSATNWSDLSSQLVGDEQDIEEPILITYDGLQFDGSTVTGYNGTAEDIVIPSNYSITTVTKETKGVLIEASILSDFEEFSYESIQLETLDGTTITKSGENLSSLAETYTELYLKSISLIDTMLAINILDNITYPVYCNNQQFNSVSDFEDYVMLNSIDELNFAGTMQFTSYVQGNDYTVTTIGDSAFKGNTDLISVTIPNTVTSIGELAFYQCSSLIDINIPNSVTSLGRCAFSECISIMDITIPNSVTTMGNSVFYGTGLTTIHIPNSITSIPEYAFTTCKSLTSITFDENINLSTIERNAFAGTGLINVIIPDSVTTIHSMAFANCQSLTSIYIPSSVTTILSDNGKVFGSCTNKLTIYCGAETQPTDWASDWNIGTTTLTVNWGVTLEEYKNLINA